MLSVLINDYNDHEECALTVRSIRDTAGGTPEVVVVDDGSPSALNLNGLNAEVHRMQHRIGVGPSRYVAATHATRDWILIVDSHCRFVPGWYETACDAAKSGSEKTIWNFQCVGLAPGNMDMSKPHGAYFGSSILFSGADSNKPGEWQVLEGKWLPSHADNIQVGGLMGACYMMHRDWFFQIGALKMLRHWGSDEPDLALRSWLSGGECRFTKAVRVGHQFRKVAFHRNPTSSLVFNKMLIALVCLPQNVAEKLIADLPKQYPLPGDIALAHRWIAESRPLLECERAFFQAQQRMSFDEYCERFAIQKSW